MISLTKIIEDQPNGVTKSTWDDLKTDFQRRVGLGENTNRDLTMNKAALKQLVKEEYVKIQKEAIEKAPKIAKKLAELREEMAVEFFKRERVGTTFEAPLEKRIQLQTVSEMIDVPVNELVLYFLNHVKTMNERSLVEYRLGHVYFYAQ